MTKHYEQIRNKIKFGDVIAFSGKGRVSELIKWKTNSDISHVGLVYDVAGRFGDRRIFLMESSTLVDLPDYKTKQLFKGVQYQLLSQRLNSYKGSAYWLKLGVDLNENQEKSMYDWLTKKHSQRTPYDSVQAMGSALDKLDRFGLENEPDYSSLFCSELVAKAYKIAGLFNGNPSEQTPQDIVDLDIYDELIKIK